MEEVGSIWSLPGATVQDLQRRLGRGGWVCERTVQHRRSGVTRERECDERVKCGGLAAYMQLKLSAVLPLFVGMPAWHLRLFGASCL